MEIAQISDLHICAAGDTFGVAPMAKNLRRVVADLNANQPDMVLVSGDIANSAERAETERAAGELAMLKMPYFITPGNHDDRSILRSVFGQKPLPAREKNHLSYTLFADPYLIIALDSTDPDAPNGRICAERLGWLSNQLEAAPNQQTLLFMHHPPMKCGAPESDNPPLEGAAALGALVAKHSQIERILCGHIHLMVQTLWQGCLVSTAPSLGMRLRWRPNGYSDSKFFASAPAYLWHMQNDDGELITHTVTLDSPAGPYEFE